MEIDTIARNPFTNPNFASVFYGGSIFRDVLLVYLALILYL
jgi:hypothetical protein